MLDADNVLWMNVDMIAISFGKFSKLSNIIKGCPEPIDRR